MATVTVTETGVTIQAVLVRDEFGVDSVSFTAVSLTNVPAVQGRVARDQPVTLNPAQAAVVKQVLDALEAMAKSAWQIP